MAIEVENYRDKIKELAEKYHLSLVLLFGSQASGETHKESDTDIAYLAQRQLSLREEGKLIIDLMQIFRTKAIDLTSIRNSSPLLCYQIARFGKTIYEATPDLFTFFYIIALRKYDEAKPLFQLRSNYLDKKIAKMKV